MKNLFIITTVSLFAMSAFAKAEITKTDSVMVPPVQVKTAFEKKFVNATNVEWELEENQVWEAEFELNAVEMSSFYDATGKWLETETELKVVDLPAEILKAVVLKFEDWEIEEVCKVESSSFKGYEIEIEKGNTKAELTATSATDLIIKDIEVEDGHGKQKGEKGEKSKDKKKGKKGKR